jgi:hypothetical protein
MQVIKDPLKTTVKGLFSSKAPKPAVIKRIQDKIFYYGLCSDDEHNFLVKHAAAEPLKVLTKW